MERMVSAIVLLGLLVSGGCASQSSQSRRANAAAASAEEGAATDGDDREEMAQPPESWVDERVAEAKRRLTRTEAGKLVWRSIEAHGGLRRWYANGPLHFRYDYAPIDGRTVRDTYQTVDTWSARARQQLADDREVEFGWDGEQAWVAPGDAELEINARFWALTPYYFVGMPFVLADPGVDLEKRGEAELHGRPHDVVKATFGEGVGDSPDDYYVVYLDAETGRFGGLRYIVTYPGFFPDGGHSPPKIMVYEGEQTVEGITFAKRQPAYKWDPEAGERGEQVTDITLSDVEFRPDTPDGYFDRPEGARIQEGY